MSEVALSGSSLNTFIECPKRWEYEYVFTMGRAGNFKMALGTAAHAALEVGFMGYLKDGWLPALSVWFDAYQLAWAKESEGIVPKNDSPQESAEFYRQSGWDCVLFYAQNVAPHITPIAVERNIAIRINGVLWTGTIDLLEAIDKDPKRIRIRDYKFTGKRPDNNRYIYPMTGYALGVRKDFGIIEEDVQLDYIIRNKKPILFPVATGRSVSEDEIFDLASQIEYAMNMINKGSFPPLGNQSSACNWCAYRDICPDSSRRRNA
jgi:CRISPR/Cas system-associated exonuclease Cas4 (RecB family)